MNLPKFTLGKFPSGDNNETFSKGENIMYFRNFKEFKPYTLTADSIRDGQVENIQLALEPHKFVPCEPSDRIHTGFISPFGSDSEQLYHAVGNQFLFYIQTETRPVPSSEVHSALQKRIEEFKERTQKEPEINEVLSLRDAVEVSLQQRAFSKYKLSRVWVDFDSMMVFVDSCTEKTAETCLALLRKAFGSLPVLPLKYQESLSTIAHRWLRDDKHELGVLKNNQLVVSGDFSLQSMLEPKQKMSVKEFNFSDGDLIDLILSSNMMFKDIALSSLAGITMKLRDDFSLKSVNFENKETDHEQMAINGDTQVGNSEAVEPKEDPAVMNDRAYFDAEFTLMALEMQKIYKSMAVIFGGAV